MQVLKDPTKSLARQYREAIEPTPAHIERERARLMERIAAEAQASPAPPKRVNRVLLVGSLAAALLLVWGALHVYIDLSVQRAVDASLAARQGAAPAQPRDVIFPTEPALSLVAPPMTLPPEVREHAGASGTAPLSEAPMPAVRVATPTSARPPRGTPEVDADELLREGALLSRAREAQARGDWSRVLELVDEHKTSHPQGGLLEERLVLEAAAACSAGQRTRAQKATQALRRRFPRSLALARVADMCKETDNE
ncbi:MAG: hypothetical protein H0T76_00620 [Nannocystis sp.]|nr:hypothetical protein [Nannocystis sp.]MBA3544963.1 hypothetical protein [Nannocystis sp.]